MPLNSSTFDIYQDVLYTRTHTRTHARTHSRMHPTVRTCILSAYTITSRCFTWCLRRLQFLHFYSCLPAVLLL